MSELERSLRRLRGLWRRPGKEEPSRVELGPVSPFDALLDQRIQALERATEELKGRVNGLIFLMVGAVLTQIVLSLLK